MSKRVVLPTLLPILIGLFLTFSVSAQGEVYIEASLNNDWISAHGFSGNVDIYLYEPDSVEPAFSGTFQADENGDLRLERDVHGLDLRTGSKFVADDSIRYRELILEYVHVEGRNLDSDTVWGTAALGYDVRVQIGDEMQSYSIVVTEVSGPWEVDFSTIGVEIEEWYWIGAMILDGDGDLSIAEWPPPFILANTSNEWVEVQGYPPDTAVEMIVYDFEGGDQICYGLEQTDPGGSVWFDCWENGITEDNFIEADDGLTYKDLTVKHLSIDDLNFEEELVSGTAPPLVRIRVEVCTPEWDCNEVWITTSAGDPWVPWVVDFSPFDLTPESYVAAFLIEDDGDATMAEPVEPEPPPSPFFEANITHEWIDFFEFPPRATVDVSISNAEGPIFEGDVDTDEGGYSHLDLWEFEKEINPGDVIVVSTEVVEKELLLVDLTLDELNIADGEAHLEGIAPEGATVFVLVCNPPPDEFTEPDCINGEVYVEEGTEWSIDLAPPFPISPDAEAWVYVYDGDGDATMAMLSEEPIPEASFIVFPVYDFVQGFGWSEGEEVTLIVDDDTDPDNGFLLMTTGISTLGEWGVSVDFHLDEIDIQPGYRVVMFGGEPFIFKMHDVTDLSITNINADDNTISGTAYPGTDVNLWAHWPPGTDILTTADESGNWVGTFEYDLVPGVGGIAAQFDDDGDGTFIEWLVVTPEWIIEEIERLIDEGRIAPQMKNSLLSKLNNAIKSLGKGNENAAVGQLEALANQIEAQQGKKIDEDVARMLLHFTWHLIQQILMP